MGTNREMPSLERIRWPTHLREPPTTFHMRTQPMMRMRALAHAIGARAGPCSHLLMALPSGFVGRCLARVAVTACLAVVACTSDSPSLMSREGSRPSPVVARTATIATPNWTLRYPTEWRVQRLINACSDALRGVGSRIHPSSSRPGSTARVPGGVTADGSWRAFPTTALLWRSSQHPGFR
jgi:hypothetical protein